MQTPTRQAPNSAQNRTEDADARAEIRALVLEAFLNNRRPGPDCTAPHCRCESPCETIAAPVLTAEDLAALDAEADDLLYRLGLQALGVSV